MPTIDSLHAREVLDSRGHPTVEVEMTCHNGAWGKAIVPAGASTGRAEACELRDGDPLRYDGRGVLRAVGHVNEVLAPALIGFDCSDQFTLDRRLLELDGTERKIRLGANALLGVSLAAAHAAAAAERMPLWRHINRLWREALAEDWEGEAPDEPRMPRPMVNMISGGLHAGGNLDFQDFLIVPMSSEVLADGLERIVRVYRRLGELLTADGHEGRLVADEGGYGPRLGSNRQAAEFVVRAIEAAGLRPGQDMVLALDVASSHFYDGTHYCLSDSAQVLPLSPGEGRGEGEISNDPATRDRRALTYPHAERGKGEEEGTSWAASPHPALSRRERGLSANPGDLHLSSDQMIDHLASLVDDFPIVSIEDGLAEEDWDGWRQLTARLGERVRLVGDDLFTTNQERLRRGIALGAANSVLIKPNQIGTLTETLHTMRLAAGAGFERIVSARSGETEDTTIADLAVGTAAEGIKIGSVTRGERLAKYNRLLRIEKQMSRG